MSYVQKCISFTDIRVIDKLKTVKNQSYYLSQLVLKDLEPEEKEDLKQLIKEALRELNFSPNFETTEQEINLQAVLDILNQ